MDMEENRMHIKISGRKFSKLLFLLHVNDLKVQQKICLFDATATDDLFPLNILCMMQLFITLFDFFFMKIFFNRLFIISQNIFLKILKIFFTFRKIEVQSLNVSTKLTQKIIAIRQRAVNN